MAQKIDFAKLTLKDALDLAILIEEEAKVRYEEFARLVGGRYKGDSDEVFKNMAVYEAKHRDELKARRQKLFGSAPVTVSLDAIDDVEAPDRGQPRVFMSPRQAMEVALGLGGEGLGLLRRRPAPREGSPTCASSSRSCAPRRSSTRSTSRRPWPPSRPVRTSRRTRPTRRAPTAG